MSDQTVNTQLLLTINANIEGMKKVTDEFGAMQRKASEAQTKVETLGDKLKAAFSGNVMALGAAFKVTTLSIDKMVETIGEAVTGTTAMASEIKRMNRLFGLSAEQVQVFAEAGRMAFEELSRYMGIFQMKVGDALLDKTGSVAKAFKENLKLNPEELEGKTTAEQLMLVADAFAHIDDRNKKAALAMDLFGRNSAQMLVLLEKLRKDGFEKLAEETERNEGLLSQGMVNAIAKVKREVHEANEKLTKGFAETNLKLLQWKAGVIGFLADHAAAIERLGTALAVGTVAYMAFSKAMANAATINAFGQLFGELWAKGFGTAMRGLPGLVSAALGPAGMAIGTALGGAIVLVLGKMLIDCITEVALKANERIDKIRAERSLASVLQPAISASGADEYDKAVKAADARVAAAKAENEALDKSRIRFKPMFGNEPIVREYTPEEQEKILRNNELIAGVERLRTKEILERGRTAAIARGEQAAADAAKKKAEADTEDWIKKVLKTDKELTGEQIRQLALQDTKIKNSDQMRVALEAAKVAAEKDYDAQIARAGSLPDQTQGAEVRKRLEQDKNVEVAKYAKAIEAIDRHDIENRLRLQEMTAKDGTLKDQIAAKESLLRDATTNALLSESERTNEIKRIRQEITELTKRAAVEAAQAAAEEARRDREHKLALIEANRFLTEEQKKSQRYTVYSAERAALPGEISAAEGAAAAASEGDKGYFTGEVSRLKSRQSSVEIDVEANRPLTLMEQLGERMVQLQNGWGTMTQQIADSFSSITTSIQGGLSNAIQGLINRTMTWRQALQSVGSAILSSVVTAIAEMAAKFIVTRTLMFVTNRMFGAAEVASTAAQASAAALMWAPAATAASIASFGAASAAGLAAYMAALGGGIAGTAAMSAATAGGGMAAAGHAAGGIIIGPGTGTSDSIPARLSNGEYVVTAAATRRIGVQNLDAMNYNGATPGTRKYADGGYVQNDQSGRTIIMVVGTHQEAQRIAANSENDAVIVDAMKRNSYRL